MTHILIADNLDGIANLEKIFGKRHQFTLAPTMHSALAALEQESFDLIIIGDHFDDSRMFELLPKVRRSPTNGDKPIICFCNPDAEMRRVIERNLTKQMRKATQIARVELQNEREDIQRLRSDLLLEEWSLDLEDRLGDLRCKLAHALLELSTLYLNNSVQQAEIDNLRNLKDRVSDAVFADQNASSLEERIQILRACQEIAGTINGITS